jgi:uncharacterized membrane protein
MKDFLQGKWLKHPLHPLLVHIPTALWPAAFVFDILSMLGVGGNAMVQTSFYSILFGLVVALAAAAAGLADWLEIRPGKPAKNMGLIHAGINVTVTLVQIVNLALRWGTYATGAAVDTLPVVLSLVSTLALLVSGYLGGRMVYDQGISIARLSKGEWRDRAEKAGNAVPEKGGDA